MPRSVGEVARALSSVPAKRLMMVADYAAGAARSLDALSRIATALDADIYSARFHVQGTVDPLHRNFRGQLPATTGEGNQILSRYHTMLLVGEKVDTFTYYGISALPGDLQVIQVAPATTQLGFDYPCEMAVLGDIRATLEAIAGELGAGVASDASRAREAPVAALEAKYPSSGKRPSDALILGVLRHLDLETHVITEGSSEDAIVQDMAVQLGFRNVHFSPRGGGLGWAMPSASASGSRPASTRSALSGTVAACFRSTRSGPPPSTESPRSSSASSTTSIGFSRTSGATQWEPRSRLRNS